MPARTLKAVGIGAGYFAPFHYEAWARIPEVAMTAVHDRDEGKARRIAERFGVPRTYSDWRLMLDAERPDVLDIVTPPETHEELCAAAAERGIHVICQKPLAPTLEASSRIVARARASGIRFMVHENFRWQPWYRAIKQVQQDGVIGQFTHVLFLMRLGDGWRPDAYLDRQPFFREYPRLLVYETGVHFIDTFRYLLGEITSVYAQLRRLNPVITGEDAGQVFLRFAGGATALWDANRYNETEAAAPRYTFGEMRIDATGGHLVLEASSTIRIKRLGEAARDLEYAREDRNFGGDCVYRLQQHFVDCLQAGTPFESEGEDYLRTIAAVEAAYTSAATGLPVAPVLAGDLAAPRQHP